MEVKPLNLARIRVAEEADMPEWTAVLLMQLLLKDMLVHTVAWVGLPVQVVAEAAEDP